MTWLELVKMAENEEDRDGYFEQLEKEADRLLRGEEEREDVEDVENVEAGADDLVVHDYERSAPSYPCLGCGKELLLRPAFKEKQYCILCRIRESLGIGGGQE